MDDPKPQSSNPSENPVGASCGHPVNCATGTFWHQWDDLHVPGRGVPLDFQRTYDSALAGTDGPLGFGWTDFTGERAAIDEFNSAHGERKIDKIHGLRFELPPEDFQLPWHEQLYVAHAFDHPRYGELETPIDERWFEAHRLKQE